MISCPCCENNEVDRLGVIQHSSPLMIARVPLEFDITAFDYLLCSNCKFQFKRPEIPETLLLECYAKSEGDRWGFEIDPNERNFDRISDVVTKYANGRRILDIGCSNGSFLSFLDDHWERYGIEPSEEASRLAERRGIQIVASTIEEKVDHKFDVIVAMDVMEHVPKPVGFLSRVSELLAPNGIFVITTGDTDSWTWRLQGPKYWYCSTFPEHVSFYNQKSLKMLGMRFNLESIAHTKMSYKRSPAWSRLKEATKGITFAIGQKTNWLGIKKLQETFAKRGGTNWSTANDHMIHVHRKVDC